MSGESRKWNGGRNEGIPAFSVFDTSVPPTNAGEGDEFVQLFVTGDLCYHEPAPALCHKSGAFAALRERGQCILGTVTSPLAGQFAVLAVQQAFLFRPCDRLRSAEVFAAVVTEAVLMVDDLCDVQLVLLLFFSAFILSFFQCFPWAPLEI